MINSIILLSGNKTAVKRNASNDRTSTRTGANYSGQLLHECETAIDGQMERRRPNKNSGQFTSPTGFSSGVQQHGSVGRVVTCELPSPALGVFVNGRDSMHATATRRRGNSALSQVRCPEAMLKIRIYFQIVSGK